MEKLDKARLLSKLSSAEGQPFSEFNVAVDRDTILAEYFDNGFPAGYVRVEFQARAQSPTASTCCVRQYTKASSNSCARC